MLSKDVLVVDVNPARWRNLGTVFEHIYPWKSTLYMLHENGRVINIVKNYSLLSETEPFDPDHASDWADAMLAKHSDVDEIQIYDKAALISYTCDAQNETLFSLEVDEYLRYLNRRLYQTDGILIRERKPKSNRFLALCEYAEEKLPKSCVAAVCIYRDEELFFDMVLGFEHKKLELVTSLDCLAEYKAEGDTLAKDQQRLSASLSSQFHKPAYAFCLSENEFYAFLDTLSQKPDSFVEKSQLKCVL